VRRAHAAREAWRFALGRGRYQRATITIEDHLWPIFRTFWGVFWGISLDQIGEFLWTRQAQAISASEAIPIERICFNGRRTGLGTRRVSPHMPARAIQAYLLQGASHRPAHQLLRSRNLGQRHSTTATRARQASTSASIRLPPTVLACPNAYALQVLAADSARPPAQSPLGVALERTRVRTRSVTTTYSPSRLRPRQSSLRSSAVIPGPNSRSTALVAKN
jgi:hypothetical protein